MTHAFEALTPDLVLDALDTVGLRGDGRLMALSSYENRVYQVHLEDGTSVIAKFYRPERWNVAQILEEHGSVWVCKLHPCDRLNNALIFLRCHCAVL
jgi:Ser/Thr protein kinase RdoA (MazF antagonist)